MDDCLNFGCIGIHIQFYSVTHFPSKKYSFWAIITQKATYIDQGKTGSILYGKPFFYVITRNSLTNRNTFLLCR